MLIDVMPVVIGLLLIVPVVRLVPMATDVMFWLIMRWLMIRLVDLILSIVTVRVASKAVVS